MNPTKLVVLSLWLVSLVVAFPLILRASEMAVIWKVALLGSLLWWPKMVWSFLDSTTRTRNHAEEYPSKEVGATGRLVERTDLKNPATESLKAYLAALWFFVGLGVAAYFLSVQDRTFWMILLVAGFLAPFVFARYAWMKAEAELKKSRELPREKQQVAKPPEIHLGDGEATDENGTANSAEKGARITNGTAASANSWKKHLPQWAIDYGRQPVSGNWVVSLNDECDSIEDRENSACAFGLALGIFLSLNAFAAWQNPDLKTWVLKATLFFAGTWGFFGWALKAGDLRLSQRMKDLLARFKAREREFSTEELEEVQQHRDWIHELYNAQEREIRLGKIGFVRDWKLWRLQKSHRAETLRFYDLFLRDAKTHR